MSTRPPPLGLPPGRSGYRSKETPQPSRRSTSLMISTSRMSGTSSKVVRPAASSAAAMSLRALFFAPVTRTRPLSLAPPVTSKHSTGSPYGGPWPDSASSRPRLDSHDGPADAHLHEDGGRRADTPRRHEPGGQDRPAPGGLRRRRRGQQRPRRRAGGGPA